MAKGVSGKKKKKQPSSILAREGCLVFMLLHSDLVFVCA